MVYGMCTAEEKRKEKTYRPWINGVGRRWSKKGNYDFYRPPPGGVGAELRKNIYNNNM